MGGLYNTTLHNLQVIQNTLLKIIFKKDKRYSTDILYEETDLFTIRKLYIYQGLIWMLKTPVSYRIHAHNTRAMQNLTVNVPFCKKAHTQRFIFYLGPKLYNMLPTKIKNLTNKTKLKKELKIYINENFHVLKILFTN